MSELFQPGQHPDADQLSAFAEQALPAHEQQQMLAHLAHCASCREIAYLAEEAELEELTAAHPAVTQAPSVSKSRFQGWFSGWNLAWAAAAAVACLTVLAIQLHLFTVRKSGENTTTVASNSSPSRIAPSASRETTKLQPSTPRENLSRGSSKNVSARPDIDTASEPVTIALSPQNVDSATLTGRDAAELVRMQPAPATSAEKSASAGIPAGSANAAATTPQGAGAVTVVSGADAEVPMDTAEVSATLNNELVGSKASSQRPTELPSHLAAVSTISNGRIALAIDAAGALFASKDAGKHWKSVSPKWTGHAVQVAFVSARQPEVNAPRAAAYDRAAITSPALAAKTQSEAPPAIPIGASTVSGIVTDQTGARIAGVKVTLTKVDSADRRDVTTDNIGHYAIDQLLPGEYALEVRAQGFQPWRQTGIEVSVSHPAIADIKLKVGAENAAVTVVAEAPSVQTDSNPVSTPIKGEPGAAWPAVFQLTTDTGAVWTSTDGRHWKHK